MLSVTLRTATSCPNTVLFRYSSTSPCFLAVESSPVVPKCSGNICKSTYFLSYFFENQSYHVESSELFYWHFMLCQVYQSLYQGSFLLKIYSFASSTAGSAASGTICIQEVLITGHTIS